MIVVTGGAGFIGANLIAALNARGEQDILLVDNLSNTAKIANIADLQVTDYLSKERFRDALQSSANLPEIRAIFHQGACSDTMVTDGEYVMDNNYQYSKDVLSYCQYHHIPLIYASSASVYGAGSVFKEHPQNEHPLNAYAYSKWQFDQFMRRLFANNALTSQVVGLRYFNVYGPREQHKGRMASVAWHFYNQMQEQGYVNLFAGGAGYADGGQLRDFVSVEDVIRVNLHFYDHPEHSGIYNCGTGNAQSFNDVALAVVNRLRRDNQASDLSLQEAQQQNIIRYIPMPQALEGKYQSYTQADTQALLATGISSAFIDVETGVNNYIDQRQSAR